MDNGKAIIEDNLHNYIITIPSKKNWFVLIFATFWLGGWVFGEVSVIHTLTRPNATMSMFLLFWLCGWTLAGGFIITVLLWGYLGKEKLIIDRQEVRLEKTVFGIGIKKILDRSKVSNFRYNGMNENPLAGNRFALYGLGQGKIKFDYGFKTYSLGLALDEAEANHLITILNHKVLS